MIPRQGGRLVEWRMHPIVYVSKVVVLLLCTELSVGTLLAKEAPTTLVRSIRETHCEQSHLHVASIFGVVDDI
jgi:hypothetical protein